MFINSALVGGVGHARVGGWTPNGTFYGPMALSDAGGGTSPQAVTPDPGLLTITGYAPTVVRTNTVTENLVLDFEDIALGTAVSNQYAANGLTFSSGNLAVANVADPGGTQFFPASTAVRSGPTFLKNSVDGGGFSITIASGYVLNSLTLDASANSGGMRISVVTISSGTSQGFEIFPSNFNWQLGSIVNVTAPGTITRLDFSTTASGRFAIDHLIFSLTH